MTDIMICAAASDSRVRAQTLLMLLLKLLMVLPLPLPLPLLLLLLLLPLPLPLPLLLLLLLLLLLQNRRAPVHRGQLELRAPQGQRPCDGARSFHLPRNRCAPRTGDAHGVWRGGVGGRLWLQASPVGV